MTKLLLVRLVDWFLVSPQEHSCSLTFFLFCLHNNSCHSFNSLNGQRNYRFNLMKCLSLSVLLMYSMTPMDVYSYNGGMVQDDVDEVGRVWSFGRTCEGMECFVPQNYDSTVRLRHHSTKLQIILLNKHIHVTLCTFDAFEFLDLSILYLKILYFWLLLLMPSVGKPFLMLHCSLHLLNNVNKLFGCFWNNNLHLSPWF